MRFLPRGITIFRRLLSRLHDTKAHNEYLARVNAKLAKKNGQLSVEATTLRWRVEDLERAINEIGTEDD